jgi:hypothetical protein
MRYDPHQIEEYKGIGAAEMVIGFIVCAVVIVFLISRFF